MGRSVHVCAPAYLPKEWHKNAFQHLVHSWASTKDFHEPKGHSGLCPSRIIHFAAFENRMLHCVDLDQIQRSNPWILMGIVILNKCSLCSSMLHVTDGYIHITIAGIFLPFLQNVYHVWVDREFNWAVWDPYVHRDAHMRLLSIRICEHSHLFLWAWQLCTYTFSCSRMHIHFFLLCRMCWWLQWFRKQCTVGKIYF